MSSQKAGDKVPKGAGPPRVGSSSLANEFRDGSAGSAGGSPKPIGLAAAVSRVSAAKPPGRAGKGTGVKTARAAKPPKQTRSSRSGPSARKKKSQVSAAGSAAANQAASTDLAKTTPRNFQGAGEAGATSVVHQRDVAALLAAGEGSHLQQGAYRGEPNLSMLREQARKNSVGFGPHSSSAAMATAAPGVVANLGKSVLVENPALVGSSNLPTPEMAGTRQFRDELYGQLPAERVPHEGNMQRAGHPGSTHGQQGIRQTDYPPAGSSSLQNVQRSRSPQDTLGLANNRSQQMQLNPQQAFEVQLRHHQTLRDRGMLDAGGGDLAPMVMQGAGRIVPGSQGNGVYSQGQVGGQSAGLLNTSGIVGGGGPGDGLLTRGMSNTEEPRSVFVAPQSQGHRQLSQGNPVNHGALQHRPSALGADGVGAPPTARSGNGSLGGRDQFFSSSAGASNLIMSHVGANGNPHNQQPQSMHSQGMVPNFPKSGHLPGELSQNRTPSVLSGGRNLELGDSDILDVNGGPSTQAFPQCEADGFNLRVDATKSSGVGIGLGGSGSHSGSLISGGAAVGMPMAHAFGGVAVPMGPHSVVNGDRFCGPGLPVSSGVSSNPSGQIDDGRPTPSGTQGGRTQGDSQGLVSGSVSNPAAASISGAIDLEALGSLQNASAMFAQQRMRTAMDVNTARMSPSTFQQLQSLAASGGSGGVPVANLQYGAMTNLRNGAMARSIDNSGGVGTGGSGQSGSTNQGQLEALQIQRQMAMADGVFSKARGCAGNMRASAGEAQHSIGPGGVGSQSQGGSYVLPAGSALGVMGGKVDSPGDAGDFASLSGLPNVGLQKSYPNFSFENGHLYGHVAGTTGVPQDMAPNSMPGYSSQLAQQHPSFDISHFARESAAHRELAMLRQFQSSQIANGESRDAYQLPQRNTGPELVSRPQVFQHPGPTIASAQVSMAMTANQPAAGSTQGHPSHVQTGGPHMIPVGATTQPAVLPIVRGPAPADQHQPYSRSRQLGMSSQPLGVPPIGHGGNASIETQGLHGRGFQNVQGQGDLRSQGLGPAAVNLLSQNCSLTPQMVHTLQAQAALQERMRGSDSRSLPDAAVQGPSRFVQAGVQASPTQQQILELQQGVERSRHILESNQVPAASVGRQAAFSDQVPVYGNVSIDPQSVAVHGQQFPASAARIHQASRGGVFSNGGVDENRKMFNSQLSLTDGASVPRCSGLNANVGAEFSRVHSASGNREGGLQGLSDNEVTAMILSARGELANDYPFVQQARATMAGHNIQGPLTPGLVQGPTLGSHSVTKTNLNAGGDIRYRASDSRSALGCNQTNSMLSNTRMFSSSGPRAGSATTPSHSNQSLGTTITTSSPGDDTTSQVSSVKSPSSKGKNKVLLSENQARLRASMGSPESQAAQNIGHGTARGVLVGPPGRGSGLGLQSYAAGAQGVRHDAALTAQVASARVASELGKLPLGSGSGTGTQSCRPVPGSSGINLAGHEDSCKMIAGALGAGGQLRLGHNVPGGNSSMALDAAPISHTPGITGAPGAQGTSFNPQLAPNVTPCGPFERSAQRAPQSGAPPGMHTSGMENPVAMAQHDVHFSKNPFDVPSRDGSTFALPQHDLHHGADTSGQNASQVLSNQEAVITSRPPRPQAGFTATAGNTLSSKKAEPVVTQDGKVGKGKRKRGPMKTPRRAPKQQSGRGSTASKRTDPRVGGGSKSNVGPNAKPSSAAIDNPGGIHVDLASRSDMVPVAETNPFGGSESGPGVGSTQAPGVVSKAKKKGRRSGSRASASSGQKVPGTGSEIEKPRRTRGRPRSKTELGSQDAQAMAVGGLAQPSGSSVRANATDGVPTSMVVFPGLQTDGLSTGSQKNAEAVVLQNAEASARARARSVAHHEVQAQQAQQSQSQAAQIEALASAEASARARIRVTNEGAQADLAPVGDMEARGTRALHGGGGLDQFATQVDDMWGGTTLFREPGPDVDTAGLGFGDPGNELGLAETQDINDVLRQWQD